MTDAVKRVRAAVGQQRHFGHGTLFHFEHLEDQKSLAGDEMFQALHRAIEQKGAVLAHEFQVDVRFARCGHDGYGTAGTALPPPDVARNVLDHLVKEAPESAALRIVDKVAQTFTADCDHRLHQILKIGAIQMVFGADGVDHGAVLLVEFPPGRFLHGAQPPQMRRPGGVKMHGLAAAI